MPARKYPPAVRNRVAELMAARMMTIDQLRAASGLSWPTVQEVVNGDRVPRVATLQALAKALRIEPPHGVLVLEGDGGTAAVLSRSDAAAAARAGGAGPIKGLTAGESALVRGLDGAKPEAVIAAVRAHLAERGQDATLARVRKLANVWAATRPPAEMVAAIDGVAAALAAAYNKRLQAV